MIDLFSEALTRDKGVCHKCGLDTLKLRAQMTRAISRVSGGSTIEGVESLSERLLQLQGMGFPREAVVEGKRLWALLLTAPIGQPQTLATVKTECLQCVAQAFKTWVRGEEPRPDSKPLLGPFQPNEFGLFGLFQPKELLRGPTNASPTFMPWPKPNRRRFDIDGEGVSRGK